jgi:hypothetical protein
MKRWQQGVAGVLMGATTLVIMAGCGEQQQLRDLENVPVTEPDKVRLVVGVDEYPNVVAFCIEGVGFVATTRADRPLQESPGLTEGWCRQ